MSSHSVFPDGVEQLAFDLHSMPIDELNHLWGTLGSSYLPSVLYRVRTVPIQKQDTELAAQVTSVEVQSGRLK